MEHLDEGREEIVHSLPELLYVGVLVRGPFVPVHGEALVHDLAIEVLFLAQGLHDELLEIFGEEHQAVSIRKDHHIFLPGSSCGVIPGKGQKGRRISEGFLAPRDLIAQGRARKHFFHINTLEHGWNKPYCRHFGRSPTDPVPHWENSQPAVFFCCVIKPASHSCNGHGVPFEQEPGLSHRDRYCPGSEVSSSPWSTRGHRLRTADRGPSRRSRSQEGS